jgi:hypothetical protein
MKAIISAQFICSVCGWYMLHEFAEKALENTLYCGNLECSEHQKRYKFPSIELDPVDAKATET